MKLHWGSCKVADQLLETDWSPAQTRALTSKSRWAVWITTLLLSLEYTSQTHTPAGYAQLGSETGQYKPWSVHGCIDVIGHRVPCSRYSCCRCSSWGQAHAACLLVDTAGDMLCAHSLLAATSRSPGQSRPLRPGTCAAAAGQSGAGEGYCDPQLHTCGCLESMPSNMVKGEGKASEAA